MRGVVEASPIRAAGGEQNPRCRILQPFQFCKHRRALFLRQAAVQNKAVFHLITQSLVQQRQMVSAFGKDQHLAAFLPGSQHITSDAPIADEIMNKHAKTS